MQRLWNGVCGWLQFIDALGPICLLLKGTLALCSSPVGLAKQHILSICLGKREEEEEHHLI